MERKSTNAIRRAIEVIKHRQEARNAVLDQYAAAETKHGPDSPEVKTFSEQTVPDAVSSVIDAEKALLALPVTCPEDVLRKVAALCSDETELRYMNRLRDDAKSILGDPSQSDPIVPLCREWLQIVKAVNQQAHVSSLNTLAPEYNDALELTDQLELKIQQMTPQSVEGIALLASVIWQTDGPSARAGTEGWSEQLKERENAMLSRLRHGAYDLAGLSI